MSINVNSTQISALLQLYPMAIPGAEENLQPPGAYHLGIPESIHSPSTKLFMVIDPVTLFSTPFAAGDSVRLWVNSQATSVIKPIKPGEENDRIFMELPWGGLKDGLNTLYYEVTRVSGNKDKSDPILNVLFNNPVSGITVSHPSNIKPGQPATFTLTRNYPREYDVVTLTVGTWSKTITYVHPANPITYTLTTTDLQQIGDGTHPVSATVVDQLSNRNLSPTTSITITANQKVYNPPIIVQAEPGKVLDVTALNGKGATIHGLIWTGIAAGQQVWLKLTGHKPDGSTVTLQIWNGGGSQVNATWVSQGFWPKPLPASFLALLADASSLRMEFWVSEDKSNNFATATKFADQVYTVKALAAVVITFLNAPYSAPEGGQVTGIEVLVTQAGQPSAGQTVTVTLPQGTTFADGTSTKDFTTKLDGRIIVSGVKAGRTAGLFSIIAQSGGATSSAGLEIKTQGVVGPVVVDKAPTDVVTSPDDSIIYVSCYSTVVVVDAKSLQIIKRINLATRGNQSMALSKNGTRLFVAGLGASTTTITLLDPTSSELIKTINLPQCYVYKITLSPDDSLLYVGFCTGTTPTPSIYTIDVSTSSIKHILSVPGAYYLYDIKVSSDGNKIITSDWTKLGFSVIDTKSHAITRIKLPNNSAALSNSITYDDSKFVVSADTTTVGEIYEYDFPTLTLKKIYNINSNRSFNVKYNYTGELIYAIEDKNFLIIDTNSGAILKESATPPGAQRFTINYTYNKAFIACMSADTLWAVDLSND